VPASYQMSPVCSPSNQMSGALMIIACHGSGWAERSANCVGSQVVPSFRFDSRSLPVTMLSARKYSSSIPTCVASAVRTVVSAPVAIT
jgi:hypothetical protein